MSSPSAPVVLIGFCREDTISMVLSNLSKCKDLHKGGRKVFAYLDGPRTEEENGKTDRVTALMEKFRQEHFPELKIVRREKNYGCRGNIVDAITQTVDEFGRCIVIEDDVLVSRTFLTYMDEALEFYKDDARIWCINANTHRRMRLPKSYKHDVYLHPRNMCWGWGTWKDRWERVDFDMRDWPEFKSQASNIESMDALDKSLKTMLDAQYDGKLRTWDVQCSFHILKNGLYAVEPRYALSKNCGFGTSGSEHCTSANSAIATQRYYNFLPELETLEPDKQVLANLGRCGVDFRIPVRIVRKIESVIWGLMALHNDPIDC